VLFNEFMNTHPWEGEASQQPAEVSESANEASTEEEQQDGQPQINSNRNKESAEPTGDKNFDSLLAEANNESGIIDAVVALFGGDTPSEDWPSEDIRLRLVNKLREVFSTRDERFDAYRTIRREFRAKMDDVLKVHIPWIHDEKYNGMPNKDAFVQLEADRKDIYEKRDKAFDVLNKADVFMSVAFGEAVT
jgi:hypothetical protein